MNCDVRSRNTNESDRMLLLFAGLLLNLNLEKDSLNEGFGRKCGALEMFPARRESPVMNIQTLGQEIHTIAYLIA